MGDSTAGTFRAGLVFGVGAYTLWGFVPLYFNAVGKWAVPPDQLLAHRIAWSLPLLVALTTLVGGWGELFRVLRSRRLVLTLLLSSVLLAGNWLMYIYASVSGQVGEASLGYFMMPLANAFLATVVLKEKLRPAHYPALGLIAVGVAVPCVWSGSFPWLAVALPVTFGLYGLVRKQVPVDGMTGLTVEAILMLVPSVTYLTWVSARGHGHFGPDAGLNGLLVFSGFVTVGPLLLFTLSIRRLPLLANSFIQFLSPTVQFGLALFWIGESFGPDRWVAMGCTWVAVLVFIGDAVWQVRAKRRAAVVPGPAPEAAGEIPAAELAAAR